MWRFIPWALMVGLAFGSAQPAKAEGNVLLDRVVAVVNGEPILLSTVARRILRLEAEMRSYVSPDEVAGKVAEQRAKALDMVIDEVLVAQEGARQGLEVSDADIDRSVQRIKSENNVESDEQFLYMLRTQGFTLEEYRNFLKRQILVYQARRNVLGEVDVTDAEVTDYYNAHKEDFRLPDAVQLRHILYRFPPAMTAVEKERLRKRAEGNLRDLKAGIDFGALANRVSDDPLAQNGGNIGTLVRGKMLPEFEAVVFDLEPGGVVGPVETKYGYHLLKVESKQVGGYQSLEEVSDKLRELLQEQALQSKQEQWLKKLRKQSIVKILPMPDLGSLAPQP